MQDKIFRALLILSAVVIPVIGGELSTPLPMMPLVLSSTLASGTLFFLTIG